MIDVPHTRPSSSLLVACAVSLALCGSSWAGEASGDASGAPGPPPAGGDMPVDEDGPDDAAIEVGAGGLIDLHIGGLLGDNIGLVTGPVLTIGDHAIELALYVAGGSHLRTGAELRYRLQIIDSLAWWIGPGIAFDVLAADEVTIWSRLTTASTGIEIALSDLFHVGIQFSFIPRAAPLSVTFLEQDGAERRQIELEADETPFDLVDFVLRPGVSFGVRL